MTYIIIALVIGVLTSLVLAHRPIIRLIAEKRALSKIENILFSGSEKNKSNVLQDIHKITSHRLNDDMVMDYFYKIKGLQVVNINKPTNFWLKVYLTTPTKVKLNYFEQVRFYETFLNYPGIRNCNKENDTQQRLKHLKPQLKEQWVGKLVPTKLA